MIYYNDNAPYLILSDLRPYEYCELKMKHHKNIKFMEVQIHEKSY